MIQIPVSTNTTISDLLDFIYFEIIKNDTVPITNEAPPQTDEVYELARVV